MKKLSIIVPVYNVEKYIRACLESIYAQGMAEESYEVIIVNDGTMDNSMDVVGDVTRLHANTIVVDQPNQGLSVARNNGMERATGEYIAFVDSDDLLAWHCLAPLVEMAVQTQADLVVADYEKMEDEEIDHYFTAPTATQDRCDAELKTGEALFMKDLNPRECYVWRTLYRREFLRRNSIRFLQGVCYEDIPFTHECYLRAGKCLRTNSLLYIYRTGHASITTAINLKTGKDLATVIAKTWELRHLEALTPSIRERLQDNVFAALSVLLYGTSHDVARASDRKAIIRHLREQAPDMSFSHGMKQRLVSFMFLRMPCLYMSCRAFFARLQSARF